LGDVIKSRIAFLDFMRIFAFLSVLVGHKLYPQLAAIANDPSLHITFRYIAEALMPLCVGGAAGVVVFFFISGYIITHVLQQESASEFLIKRAFRIYPLYLFAVLSEALINYFTGAIQFPPASILIPRVLLIGDFTGTPYSLAGVEWTLRVEVMFYLLMGGMKSLGLLKNPKWLPLAFVGCTAFLYAVGPVPAFAGWTDGYMNLYGPFLFAGSIIYLLEHGLASRTHCIASIIVFLVAFLVTIPSLHPNWKDSNYALFACFLFISAWAGRKHIAGGTVVRVLSDVTYAVYLFHNWLWASLEKIVAKAGFISASKDLQIFVALLIVCYLAHRTVERFGIKLGQRVLAVRRKRLPGLEPTAI
jgi:peptidoglycan/LPS O-acetylase OafA/YrhL